MGRLDKRGCVEISVGCSALDGTETVSEIRDRNVFSLRFQGGFEKHCRAENRERRYESFDPGQSSLFCFRRIHGREKRMVAGESGLLQGERRGAAERVEQQPKRLQGNGATAENEHVPVRRRAIVQHHAVDIRFAEVNGRASTVSSLFPKKKARRRRSRT